LLQEEKKKLLRKGYFLLPLSCPAIAFGDGGTPSSFSKPFRVTFEKEREIQSFL
jgi:hypothetical protein